MDFFARQEASRRTTRRLVLLFGLAFFAVALATGLVLMILFGLFAEQSQAVVAGRDVLVVLSRNLGVLAALVGGIMGVMMLASLYRTATLSRGGGQVARMLGGTQIQSNDQDPTHRRLINVVEEMSIASGLPVPEIYVLDQEAGINAFAAGLTPADAAVAVTRGTLDRLNRAELQGVIAHEFSHILNGDMRLNQRLMGFGFGILVLSLMGRWLLRSSRLGYRARNRNASAGLMIGFALTIIGGIGVLLSRLIKAAVSRQREVLADASAVQFTREPSALAGALKKIGGFTTYLNSVESEEVSHMLFGRAGRSFRGWFATHPPLTERIQALDPSFKPGDWVPAEALPEAEGRDDAPVSGLAGDVASESVKLSSAGTVESAATGARLRSAIPEDLYDAAHSPESAYLLVLALGVAADDASADAQQRLLESQIGSQRSERCLRFRDELNRLDRRLWLPLLELAVPALRQRPQEQIHFLFALFEKLSLIDQSQSLYEYVLERMLRNYFETLSSVELRRPSPAGKMSIEQAVTTLLATVAVHGNADEAEARLAFDAGIGRLTSKSVPQADAVLAESRSWNSFDALDRALDRLSGLSLKPRQKALSAVEATIQHDGRISPEEGELFRAIAATLGCPIPPGSTIG